MKHMTGCFLATAIFFAGSAAYGAHPLVSDDAGTLGAGGGQLEITAEYGRDDEGGVASESTETAAALGYGLTESVDLIVTAPHLVTRTEEGGVTSSADGVSDISVELKYRFHEQDGLGLALKPGISIPSGDEQQGLGSGRVGGSVFFIATHETDFMATHLNVGYIRNENMAGERKDLWHISIAAEKELNSRVSGVANVGWQRNSDPASDDPAAFVLGGIIYSLNETVDLDLGMKYGLSHPETDCSFMAGITLSF